MVRLRLEELLEEKGRTLYWLAKETGISHTILHRYRHGQSEGIKFEHISKICNALKIKPGQLFEYESE